MNRLFNSFTALGFILALGVGSGVVLQKTLNISDRFVSTLGRVGLSPVPTSARQSIQDQLNSPVIPTRLQGRLKLYILVGQSNMVGQAEIPEGISTSANIFTFGNDYRWQVGRPPVDDATGQVDLVSADLEAGFGPAFIFAKTLIERNNNQIIGLIPCARSGSSITAWQKNPSDQSLYGSCLKRVRAASPMGTVRGILFFQGEADAIDPEAYPELQPDADAWAEKFATFAFNFRSDVGNPEVPLVYAQLGQPAAENREGLPNWDAVQQQQANIQIPNGGMIATRDLPMDGIHFTPESYQVIGQRFADAISALEEAQIQLPNGESPAPEAAL